MNAAWQTLLAAREPIDLDVPVLARKLPEHSGPSKLVVEVLDPRQRRLGSAAVFPGGWYPGRARREFAHYFPVLQAAFAGLEAQGREPLLRLQLLKAVNGQWELGRERPFVVLLKFVVAPEFAITGTRAEQVYQCPLSGFYRHFLNLGHDVLRDPSSPAFVSGQAIHRGYASAARAYLATEDDQAALGAYCEAVIDTWEELFPYLLLDRPKRATPTRTYRLPVEAADAVIGRCRQLYQGRAGPIGLLQERLFFSPTRGISGRADRIVEDGNGRELWELKTRASGWGVDKDPRSGRTAPGGVQALAYHEILRTLDGVPPRTFVELLDPGQIEGIPLAEHPVVTRAGADVVGHDDRYVDLVSQARNVAHVIESGLLTGYDREKIAQLAGQGQKLRAIGGDFDLYGSVPPCRFCPAGQRGLCEATRNPGASPWFDFFRHVPHLLFEYWAWFHGQLKQGENLQKERLFHLVSTPPSRLERDEGICVTDLLRGTRGEGRGMSGANRTMTLRRERRIETRLREDDRVLLTPMDRPPGELHSVEATVRAIGARDLVLDLYEVPDPVGAGLAPPSARAGQAPPPPESRPARARGAAPLRYRVDQLGFWDRGDWQLEGLTDFLVGCLQGGEARGRRLDVAELPRLARVILGVDAPEGPLPRPLGVPGAGRGGPGAGGGVRSRPERQPAQRHRGRAGPRARRDASGPGAAGDWQDDDDRPPRQAAGRARLLARLGRAAAGARPGEYAPRLQRGRPQAPSSLPRSAPVPRAPRPGPGRDGAGRPRARPVRAPRRRRCPPPRRRHPRWTEHARPPRPAGQRPPRRGARLRRDARRGQPPGAARPRVRDDRRRRDRPGNRAGRPPGPPPHRPRLPRPPDPRRRPPPAPAGRPRRDHDTRAAAEPGGTARDEGRGASRACPSPLAPRPSSLGLRVSLFERLASRHPDRVLTLAEQYRMCGPISELVSGAFYNGRLRPGDRRVADHHLGRFLAAVGATMPTAGFAARVFEPAYPVVMIDTALDPAARDTAGRTREPTVRDDTRDNPREAELIADLVAVLLGPLAPDVAADVAREIGIISPYRKQNNRIRQELVDRVGPAARDVRVDTVDRFQGGECELVLLSLVASNAEATVGSLHADWRRMNVAISRAKAKLVIVGDRRTFTVPSTPEEEGAKTRYRYLFELIDRQAAAGRALLVEPPA